MAIAMSATFVFGIQTALGTQIAWQLDRQQVHERPVSSPWGAIAKRIAPTKPIWRDTLRYSALRADISKE